MVFLSNRRHKGANLDRVQGLKTESNVGFPCCYQLHAVGERDETVTNPTQPQTTNVNRYFIVRKVPTNMSHALLKINEAT